MNTVSMMTQAELAVYVRSHLQTKGISVILPGSAAVAIYTGNIYVMAAIDLINISFVDRKKIVAAMKEIEFGERNRYFIHPDLKHMVEFAPGSLSVGW